MLTRFYAFKFKPKAFVLPRRHYCNKSPPIFAELKKASLLCDTTADISDLPNNCSVYVGFDPTADSLHIGNLLMIMVLQRLANHGYRPIALIGGATGQIGDPSGRSTERTLLDRQVVQNNAERLSELLKSIFQGNLTVLDNYDWFQNVLLLDFLRDVGKQFRINSMLNKDSVKSRINTDDQGMSFTEFTYQILQSNDFYHLFETENCQLQFGGSDQWGNITAGIDFIKKKTQKQSFGFTIPLLTDANGQKIGKSTAGGKIWLSRDRTSVFDFYQYWVNTADSDLEKLLNAFTFLTPEEIEQVLLMHKENPEARHGQKRLAFEITKYIHKEEGAQQAQTAAKIFFSDNILAFSPAEYEIAFAGTNRLTYLPLNEVVNQAVVDIAFSIKATSKAQARKLITGGGFYVNNSKVSSVDTVLAKEDLIDGKCVILRTGKKEYHVVFIKN